MRGHIRQHGAGWQYIIELGNDPLTGKRKQKAKGGFKKQKDAEKAMNIELAKIAKGEYFQPEEMNVRDYLKYWMETYAEVNVADSTYKRYGEFCNTVNKHLGNCMLKDLKPGHVQQFYSKLISSKTLSNSTILKVHRMLRMALKHGVGWQMINNNPTDAVIAPKAEKIEMKVWDVETLNNFLNTIKDEPIYLAAVIAAHTGMREGEIYSLIWDNVNLDKYTLSVKYTLQRNKDKILELKEPKTKKSKRTIELMDDTIKELRRYQNEQKLNKRILGDEYLDEGFVCCWNNGAPLDPHYVSQRFKILVKKYNFPVIRFHDLRHTHATLLLQEETPAKVVSERLGHSTIVVTMDTYSHVLPNMQKEAVKKLNNLFAQAR